MNYYSIERSTDHLAHYGVKGMKWGVRRALARGNEKALDRHFKKAAKKLKKLQDIGLRSGKYAAKSAAYGAAAAGVGTLAVGGTDMAGNAILSLAKMYANKGPNTKARYEQYKKIRNTGQDIKNFGNRVYAAKPIRSYIENQYGEREVLPGTKELAVKIDYKPVITGNTIYRTATGIAAAGLAAKSAQNAYRASHGAKYRQKALDFKNQMDESFRGTKYEGQYIVPPKKKKKRR